MRNLLILLLAIIFINACKPDEPKTPNRPPNAFIVTHTLKPDGKTIVLNWTKAKDPDGDAVTYAVILTDTLAKSITDTTYTITGLDFNYNQTAKIIAKDAKGLKTEASFTAITKVQLTINNLDPAFEKELVNLKIDKDGLVNGKMDVVDAKGVTELRLEYKNIKSLAGIEAFVDLKFLICFQNQLTALDISKNTALIGLVCSNNPLTTLDISKNTALIDLSCTYNQLTTLDVAKNIALKMLYCSNNQIKALDIAKNTALEKLYCYDNKLTALDISKNTALIFLWCLSNQLTALDVAKNTALQSLRCNNNQLTDLDVAKNTDLNDLYCYRNQLTALDVSKNMVLKILSCEYNLINTICVADVAKANADYAWAKDTKANYALCN